MYIRCAVLGPLLNIYMSSECYQSSVYTHGTCRGVLRNWEWVHLCVFYVCICMYRYYAVYVCVCVCWCVCICVCICMYVCVCMCMYVYVCVCICVCMCMYVYVCVCMCMYVHVCVCMCMYVYVCVCMCDVLCMDPFTPQAKKLVEGVPQVIKKDVNKEEAEKLRSALEAAGGVVEFE